MSPGDSSGPFDESDIQALLESVMPELRAIFERSPLAPERNDALLDETVRSLLYQWPKIEDRPTWLLETLERLIDLEAEHGPRAFPQKPKAQRTADPSDEEEDPPEDCESHEF